MLPFGDQLGHVDGERNDAVDPAALVVQRLDHEVDDACLDAVTAIPLALDLMLDQRLPRRVDALDALEDALSLELGERLAHRATDCRAVPDSVRECLVHGLIPEIRAARDADLRLRVTEQVDDGLARHTGDTGELHPRSGHRQGGAVRHVELVHQPRDVLLDRLLTDTEGVRDRLVAFAAQDERQDERQDLELTRSDVRCGHLSFRIEARVVGPRPPTYVGMGVSAGCSLRPRRRPSRGSVRALSRRSSCSPASRRRIRGRAFRA